MIRPGEEHPASVMMRALWLVSHQLTAPREPTFDDPRQAVFHRIEQLGFRDEQNLNRLYDDVCGENWDLLDQIDHINQYLFDLRKGRPVLLADIAARQLCRTVNPDPLAAMHINFQPSPDETLDWPAVPMTVGSEKVPLSGKTTVESHIHLGGALPPLYFWTLLIGGEFSLQNLEPGHRQTQQKPLLQRWKRTLVHAGMLRYWLALGIQLFTQTTHASGAFAPLRAQDWWDSLPKLLRQEDMLFNAETRETSRQLCQDWHAWRLFAQNNTHHSLFAFLDPDMEPQEQRPWSQTYTQADLRSITWKLCLPHFAVLNNNHRQGRPTLDPLRPPPTQLNGRNPHYAMGERRLFFHLGLLLRTLKARKDPDDQACYRLLSRQLLWYLRVVNAFHRLAVHDQGSRGLNRFVETFGQRGSFTRGRRNGTRSRGNEPSTGNPNKPNRHRRQRNRLRRTITRLERNRMYAALNAQLREPFGLLDGQDLNLDMRRIEMRVSMGRGRTFAWEMRAWLTGMLQFLADYGRPTSGPPHPHHNQPSHHFYPGLGLENGHDLAPLLESLFQTKSIDPHQLSRLLQQVAADTANRHMKREEGWRRCPVGLIVHLIKAGPANPQAPHRFLFETNRLIHLLRYYPRLRPFVVGFDAAGPERKFNPRTFVLAYHHLRRHIQFAPEHTHLPPCRFGFTFHVGEDVDDLLTGLRHIDESVSLLLPGESGGRLGHALALSIDATFFYKNRRMATRTKLGVHLLDLVWAHGRLNAANISKFNWIRELISSYLPDNNHYILTQCYQKMYLDFKQQKNRLSYPPDSGRFSETALLQLLKLSPDQAKTWTTVQVDTRWLAMITTLQNLLQSEYAKQPITVEANPTSNLLIGGFDHYGTLPYQRLIDAGISVSLNTDDPGMFMTCLPGEFAMMYKGLKDRLPIHNERWEWLNQRRRQATKSSFLSGNLPLVHTGNGYDAPHKSKYTYLNYLFTPFGEF